MKNSGRLNQSLSFTKKNDSNPFDKILLGLLYAKTGNTKKAIIVLDEFAMSEPNLMITPAIKQYIQQLVDELL